MSEVKREKSVLFLALKDEFRRFWNQVQSKEQHDVLIFPSSQIDQLGHSLFSNLLTGGYCTLVVSATVPWDPQSHYFEEVRIAARRGLKIRRSFLLPHRQYRNNPTFRDHRKMDVEAGIKVDVIFIGELLANFSLPLAGSLDFGIWDDNIVCTSIIGQSGSTLGVGEWRVSAREEDIEQALTIKKILLESASQILVTEKEIAQQNLEEPLLSTAQTADFLSSVLCRGNHISHNDCSWYHSVWQYLRVFNMVSTPTWLYVFKRLDT